MLHKNVFVDIAFVIVGGLLLTTSTFFLLEILSGNQQREISLKQEIANNLATKWNDCIAAKRWVADFKCPQ